MIQARHLTKRYGNKVAVNDISFDVHPGNVTGFLGPNGAGKSTTMRMIMGLDRPTSGQCVNRAGPWRPVGHPLQLAGRPDHGRGGRLRAPRRR